MYGHGRGDACRVLGALCTGPKNVWGADMSETFLVVGLGNPGRMYEKTRHNVGQMTLERLGMWAQGSFQSDRRAKASVMHARMGTHEDMHRVILVKPSTFMNASGTPVAALARYYSVPLGNVIVVHDEIDTEFGTVRLKRGGGEGGHNGLRDISRALSSKEYMRVRVGVGRPPQGHDTAHYVLSEFSTAERKVLDDLVTESALAVQYLVENGLVAAQQEFHSRQAIRA